MARIGNQTETLRMHITHARENEHIILVLAREHHLKFFPTRKPNLLSEQPMPSYIHDCDFPGAKISPGEK